MTDTAYEHLKEQIRAYFPDGFFLVGAKEGEIEEAVMDWDNSMQARFIGEGVIELYVQVWGIPDNISVGYEEVAFEPDGDWLEEED